MSSSVEPVITIDCHYLEPEHAAAYLMIERDRAAFVDNNTQHAVPLLVRALADQGLSPEQVQYIIITHVHLDHAGGTSALVKLCPNATVVAHPRAVRHLVDPARLIAGAKTVYGEAEFQRLYGVIEPIDAGRIHAVEDGETLAFGGRTLTFLHTRGHANHHMCVYDSASNGVFTGDSFGVGFKASRPTVKPFLVFSSAPTDFDPAEARASLRRILDTGAECVYLSHFGKLTELRAAAEVVLESIDRDEAILRAGAVSGLSGAALQDFCATRLRASVQDLLRSCGTIVEDGAWSPDGVMETDVRVSAQGLTLAAQQMRSVRLGAR